MLKIGSVAFIAGVAVCLIAGFITAHWILPLLTILGLAVGVLNVSTRELPTLVFIARGLVLISAIAAPLFRSLREVGPFLGRIYIALILFLAPAATVVALRGLFMIAKR